MFSEEILTQTEGYNVSERYQPIPTMDIIQRFERFGFELDKIEAAGIRNQEKALKQRHMVRMRSGFKPFGDELVPQVIIYNSYDATKALEIHVGMYRFVCANGMVSGHDLVRPTKIMHSNTEWENLVDEFIDTYEIKYQKQVEYIHGMKGRTITLDEAYHIVEQSLEFRHYDQRIQNEAVDPLELLVAKRREDRGNSAWLRFNVIQESLMNGYYNKYDADGGIRKAKRLTNIDEILRVNVELSDLFDGVL